MGKHSPNKTKHSDICRNVSAREQHGLSRKTRREMKLYAGPAGPSVSDEVVDAYRATLKK